MRTPSPVVLSLAALALSVSVRAAHADSDEPSEFYKECTFTCEANGFAIDVYQHETMAQHILQLSPSGEVYYTDFANSQDGATLVGSQNVAGSEYSDLYCEPSGLYINGDVYENVGSSEWNSHTTPPLNASTNPCGQATINQVLQQVEDYTMSPQWDVPAACTDLGCLGPESGVISYTDPDDDYSESDEVGFTYCWDEDAEELYFCDDSSIADESGGGGQPEVDLCWDSGMNSYLPCEYTLEDGGEEGTTGGADPDSYSSATLVVDVARPLDGTCTVDATFTVQADWSPTDLEVDMIDIYQASAGTPDAIEATSADVAFVDVTGGLHIYTTTFEVPLAEDDHEVMGGYEDASLASGIAVMDSAYVSCACAPLAGDISGDGYVGTSDLMALLAGFGTRNAAYDLDRDGRVGTSDLLLLLQDFGETTDC
jgi:hypothetical protein